MSETKIPEQPVETVDDLVAFLRAGEKPPERWRVGTEHEKIGLHKNDRSPVEYGGERGIGVLLERIADRAGWERILEDGNIIALQRGGASITLEPGGQLELSGAPLRTIFETFAEFHAHLELVRSVSESLDIVWLGLGIHPIHSVEELPRMPKERYRIMRRYLPTRGSRGRIMMFSTATVQANFDYASSIGKSSCVLAMSDNRHSVKLTLNRGETAPCRDDFNGGTRAGVGGAMRLWTYSPVADAGVARGPGLAWTGWRAAYPVPSVSGGV